MLLQRFHHCLSNADAVEWAKEGWKVKIGFRIKIICLACLSIKNGPLGVGHPETKVRQPFPLLSGSCHEAWDKQFWIDHFNSGKTIQVINFMEWKPKASMLIRNALMSFCNFLASAFCWVPSPVLRGSLLLIFFSPSLLKSATCVSSVSPKAFFEAPATVPLAVVLEPALETSPPWQQVTC